MTAVNVPAGYRALTTLNALRRHLAHNNTVAPALLCNNWAGPFRDNVDLTALPPCQLCAHIAALEIAAARRAADLEIDRSNCPVPAATHRGATGQMMRRCTCPDRPDVTNAYHRDRYHLRRRARGIPSAPNCWIDSDDVDPTAVERALRGELARMTTAERTLAVAALTGRGWSARQIGRHLRMSPRTVVRHRTRAGRTAVPA